MSMVATRGRSRQSFSWCSPGKPGNVRLGRLKNMENPDMGAGTPILCHHGAMCHPEGKVTWSLTPVGRGRMLIALYAVCSP